MYGTGTKQRLETKKGITYTGVIIEEDTISIKIKTIRNETLILAKDQIARAEEMNGTGDKDGSKP